MSDVLGITAVTQRVAEIQARMASLSPPAPASVARSTAATSFEGVLRQATTPATAPAGPAAPVTPAMRGGVPVDLARYGNGRIPLAELSRVGSGPHHLWAPAARRFEDLQAAAARDGVTIRITDSYRPYEQQVDVARRKGLYVNGGLAATPGKSNHGWGLSVDLDLDRRAQEWMRTHAARFDFREDVPREPWHWTFAPR